MLGTLASHIIDHARWYVGDIDRVCASLKTQVPATSDPELAKRPNNAVLLALQFGCGAHGVIHVSDVSLPGDDVRFEMALHGEAGALEGVVSTGGQDGLMSMRSGDATFQAEEIPDEYWHDVDRHLPLMEQLSQVFAHQAVGDRSFIDAILDDRPASPSFADGLAVQRVIEAAFVSEAEGRWIEVAG